MSPLTQQDVGFLILAAIVVGLIFGWRLVCKMVEPETDIDRLQKECEKRFAVREDSAQ